MPATAAHPITNGPGMDQKDYMRRRCKFFIIALGACMVALMSYDGIVKPLSKKVCFAIGGMLHSRTVWFQQKVVHRANCLSSEVMAEIGMDDCFQNATTRVSRIINRYKAVGDPWGTQFLAEVQFDDKAFFKCMLVSAGEDRLFNTSDDVCVTNMVSIGTKRIIR